MHAANEGELGTLYSHMARANSHWKELQDKQVMVVFAGPHAYISPTWYASGPAVPTLGIMQQFMCMASLNCYQTNKPFKW